MPKRIQRKRTKGWRLPKGCIYVGRGSHWGNPYRVVRETDGWHIEWSQHNWTLNTGPYLTKVYATRAAIDMFRTNTLPTLNLAPLRGHDLACWCRLTDLCHATALIEEANR